MREQTDSEPNPTPAVTGIPWRVVAVSPCGDYRLNVAFADGTHGQVDMRFLVLSPQAGVFAALREPALFAQVGVIEGAVTWPGDLDLAPDAMYDAIKMNGSWTPR
jgi:hypothetical protein